MITKRAIIKSIETEGNEKVKITATSPYENGDGGQFIFRVSNEENHFRLRQEIEITISEWPIFEEVK